jgi:hypothetical protein
VPQQIVRGTAVLRPPGGVVRSGTGMVSVPVARLVVKSSIREGGVNQEHVRRLMRLGGRWPPILVHDGTGVVIDGVHRVAAARLLGLVRVDASLFSGGPDEALIEFVRRNVHHGLPLTLRERKWAAGRVLCVHPDWSDRRIAGLCALSPKTVGRIRAVSDECQPEEVPQLDTRVRVGRDNRLRPVNSVSVRARVAEAIRQQPGASLRSVAAAVGVSPETVRSVRLSLTPGAPQRTTPVQPVADVVVDDVDDVAPADIGPSDGGRGLAVVTDNALLPADFAAWFERTAVVATHCSYWAEVLPTHCLEEIAAQARGRADAWLDFARLLDTRTGAPT